MLLRLPNELLVRTANFLPDEDLPALRLTCKHLVSITHKHFIAAFIRETHFEASPAGFQRLDQIVSHPTFDPHVRTCMALVSTRVLKQSLQMETRVREFRIFVERTAAGSKLTGAQEDVIK
ncbi:hypothetical protein E4T43_06066 [Aureobasidium subglaciale]|nr:hypothetical protein E4T43_06066 [Aureobasidium subglaciale]